jgi:RNA polymerase sigma-70 factor (ECF subfamily)
MELGGWIEETACKPVTAASVETPKPEVAAELLETAMVYQRVLNLIQERFEERSWQAFCQVVINGRSASETASDLHMTPNAVYLAKSRILRVLREELAEE